MSRYKPLNPRQIKALAGLLELFAIVIFLYLIILPCWPGWRYNLIDEPKIKNDPWVFSDVVKVAKQIDSQPAKVKNNLAVKSGGNRLIITKIGVDAPIVESSDERVGLDHGAWRVPDSSTPERGGNTIITGHRFKYLPPNNLTFYNLDKLVAGDIIAVDWQNKYLYYRVVKSVVVANNDHTYLQTTASSTLTLYTCTPLWSQTQRLMVVSELIK